MASLSGMVTGANEAFHGALDELSALKDSILGGILSLPAVQTALVTAANIIIAVNVLKIIKKLPANISSLQTELITIAGLTVGTVAYTKAIEGLKKSELGKAAISAGHDIGELVATTKGIVDISTDAAAIARGVARNAPNLVADAVTGKIIEVAQEALLSGENAESEEPLDEFPLNTKMMEQREFIRRVAEERNSPEALAAAKQAVAAYETKQKLTE